MSEGNIIKFLKELFHFPHLFSIKLEVNYKSFDLEGIVRDKEIKESALFKNYCLTKVKGNV